MHPQRQKRLPSCSLGYTRPAPWLIGLVFGLTILNWVILSPVAWALYARVHSISGAVRLKRANWSNFQLAHHGIVLFGDDLLKPASGSRVIVTCPDGQRANNIPTPGIETSVSSLCPGTPRGDVRPDFGVSDTWGGGDPTIPFVITPRSDFVLSATPMLRWNPSPEAETYTVTLTSLQGEVWRIATDQTAIPYPEDKPELMADGTLYELVITTDTRVSSTDENLSLKFMRSVGPDVSEAEAEIAAVRAMDLPENIKTLVLVEEIYPKYTLTAEAINALINLTEQGCKTAHIYRLLGDLYLKSGLQLTAEASYRQAIELAEAEENIEAETLAYLGLGTLYQAVNESEKAIEPLQQAQARARELGDAELLESITGQLSRLMPLFSRSSNGYQ